MRFWKKVKAVVGVLQGHSITATSTLGMRVIRGDGRVEDLGIVSRKKVTLAFVNDIVDALQGLATPYANFKEYKYHDYGTGAVGESNADTILGNDCGEAREVGTQVEAAANIYKSVATHTFAGTFAITEHGLFNVVTANTPTLMDRSVFAAINVVSGDKIESTYQLTINAEA